MPALLYLSPGQTFRSVGSGEITVVTGTVGNETVFISADADVEFEGSFNRGGDTINIDGAAGDYTAVIQGSYLVLTANSGPSNGADIRIPINAAGEGAKIQFADNVGPRVLSSDGNTVQLGGQQISLTGTTEIAVGDVAADNGLLLAATQDTGASNEQAPLALAVSGTGDDKLDLEIDSTALPIPVTEAQTGPADVGIALAEIDEATLTGSLDYLLANFYVNSWL